MAYAGINHDDGWPESASDFGSTLRAVRELVGLSRQRLAELADISWLTLRNIEEGKHATAADKRARLVAVLSSLDQPDALEPSTAPSEGELRDLRVCGPYPYRNRWRLLLCIGSARTPRSYDTRENAEFEKARLRLAHPASSQ